jgi:CRISPR-associated protein Cas1
MLKAVDRTCSDDHEWFGRCEHWRTAQETEPKRRKKHREPLVLCGHGVRLRLDRGTLLVQDGLTHYPQKRRELRFFPGDANLPDRIVILDASGSLTFDALSWLSAHNITLIQLDWRGRVQCVGGAAGYAAKPKLVAAQRAAQRGKRQIEIARWLIQEKIRASCETINEILPDSQHRKDLLGQLAGCLKRLEASSKGLSLSAILGTEGGAAAIYFGALKGLALKWSGLSKRPIPDGWSAIGIREMRWRESAQNARHPVNAMLNYGYGVLISQTRSQITAAGLDPSIGIMHGNSENRIPLVYDLMEPLRPVVDRYVLKFALSQTFTPGDFTINQWGGCRLNPQMVRAVVMKMPNELNATALIRELIRRI